VDAASGLDLAAVTGSEDSNQASDNNTTTGQGAESLPAKVCLMEKVMKLHRLWFKLLPDPRKEGDVPSTDRDGGDGGDGDGNNNIDDMRTTTEKSHNEDQYDEGASMDSSRLGSPSQSPSSPSRSTMRHHLQQLRTVFDAADTDRSGQISKRELILAITEDADLLQLLPQASALMGDSLLPRKIKEEHKEEQLAIWKAAFAKLWAQMDTDGNGYIDWEEFAKVCSKEFLDGVVGPGQKRMKKRRSKKLKDQGMDVKEDADAEDSSAIDTAESFTETDFGDSMSLASTSFSAGGGTGSSPSNRARRVHQGTRRRRHCTVSEVTCSLQVCIDVHRMQLVLTALTADAKYMRRLPTTALGDTYTTASAVLQCSGAILEKFCEGLSLSDLSEKDRNRVAAGRGGDDLHGGHKGSADKGSAEVVYLERVLVDTEEGVTEHEGAEHDSRKSAGGLSRESHLLRSCARLLENVLDAWFEMDSVINGNVSLGMPVEEARAEEVHVSPRARGSGEIVAYVLDPNDGDDFIFYEPGEEKDSSDFSGQHQRFSAKVRWADGTTGIYSIGNGGQYELLSRSRGASGRGCSLPAAAPGLFPPRGVIAPLPKSEKPAAVVIFMPQPQQEGLVKAHGHSTTKQRGGKRGDDATYTEWVLQSCIPELRNTGHIMAAARANGHAIVVERSFEEANAFADLLLANGVDCIVASRAVLEREIKEGACLCCQRSAMLKVIAKFNWIQKLGKRCQPRIRRGVSAWREELLSGIRQSKFCRLPGKASKILHQSISSVHCQVLGKRAGPLPRSIMNKMQFEKVGRRLRTRQLNSSRLTSAWRENKLREQQIYSDKNRIEKKQKRMQQNAVTKHQRILEQLKKAQEKEKDEIQVRVKERKRYEQELHFTDIKESYRLQKLSEKRAHPFVQDLKSTVNDGINSLHSFGGNDVNSGGSGTEEDDNDDPRSHGLAIPPHPFTLTTALRYLQN